MGTELDAQCFGRAKVADWALSSRCGINYIDRASIRGLARRNIALGCPTAARKALQCCEAARDAE